MANRRMFVALASFGMALIVPSAQCGPALQAPAANRRTPSGTADDKSKSGSVGVPGDANPDRIQPPSGYRVGVDDELAISVWHEPELSQTVVVRPDGLITIPLLNDIKVVGLTTDEMQALLTEKMKSLVNDPQVTIIVRVIRSRKVWLVGNVARQGAYALVEPKTVLELLSEAGGLSPFAKSHAIYILRNQGGKQVHLGFDYKKALKGKGENPILEPGDMVVVP